MASIAPIVIRCIDYLAYGTIFTRVMFRPKIKLDVFFPARKAADERWEVVLDHTATGRGLRTITGRQPFINSFLTLKE
jgi:hypothetical protein